MSSYTGPVNDVTEAFMLLEAASRGHLRTFKARLSTADRSCIGDGTTIIFDEKETGMTRWIDGKSWSPSRFRDGFFVYQEAPSKSSPDSFDKKLGLHKKAISAVAPNGRHLHLINYYMPNSTSLTNVCQFLSRFCDVEDVRFSATKFRYFKCFRTHSQSWRRLYPAPKKSLCMSPDPAFSPQSQYASRSSNSSSASFDSATSQTITLPPFESLKTYPPCHLTSEDERQLNLLSRFIQL
ncbi:Gluconate transport-inducing protein [Entomophthora muscae]|uniref:Gluconate transport-inducing protein n=1 Tax=Entomophthora muscae TaxID=34485 RepID=A0ACC2RL34_9FUNG|nr:Gluconate transport-inducing protein [Entomophthora muscae]